MPHEATVDHHSSLEPEPQPVVIRSRSSSDAVCEAPPSKRPRAPAGLPHCFAETPRQVVHVHDDGDSEEERSECSYTTSSPDTEDKEHMA